jgi:DNA-binding response OmpR family regulator
LLRSARNDTKKVSYFELLAVGGLNDMRILVIEDEAAVAQFIQQGLREAGYEVDVTHNGLEGLDYALSKVHDVIVLDIMLPGMNGLAALREMRIEGVKTPVLLLTARDAITDRVQGLDAGADDYLVKPFAFEELVARIRALSRRPATLTGNVLHLADLEMDIVSREVRRCGELIELTRREFALLEYLLRSSNQVLTRTQILDHVWGINYFSSSKVVDVYIGYLRRKIDDGFASPLIHTVRGVGYRLSADQSDEK